MQRGASGARLRARSPGRRYVGRALGQIGYAEPSALRTTAHAEGAMREFNRRTDVAAPWKAGRRPQLGPLPARPPPQPEDYDAVWDDKITSDISLEAEVARPPMPRVLYTAS